MKEQQEPMWQGNGVYPDKEYIGFRGVGLPSKDGGGLYHYEGNASACQHPPDQYAGAIKLTRSGNVADVFFLPRDDMGTRGLVGFCIRHSNECSDYGSMLDLSPWFFMEQKGWVDSHNLRLLFFTWCARENLVINPNAYTREEQVKDGQVHIHTNEKVRVEL